MRVLTHLRTRLIFDQTPLLAGSKRMPTTSDEYQTGDPPDHGGYHMRGNPWEEERYR